MTIKKLILIVVLVIAPAVQGVTVEGGATTPGQTGPGTPDEMIGVFRKIVCCWTPFVVIEPT